MAPVVQVSRCFGVVLALPLLAACGPSDVPIAWRDAATTADVDGAVADGARPATDAGDREDAALPDRRALLTMSFDEADPFHYEGRAQATIECSPCPTASAGEVSYPGGPSRVLQVGSGDVVRIQHTSAPLVTFTVAFWVSSTDDLDLPFFVCNPISVARESARDDVVVSAGTGIMHYGASVPDSWVHIAITYDGMNLRSYVDGAVTGTTRESLVAGVVDCTLGSEVDPTGLVDDLLIDDRAYSASEVAGLVGP